MVKKQRDFLRLRHAKAHVDGTLKNPLFLKIKTPRWRVGAAVIFSGFTIVTAIIGVTYIPFLQLGDVTVNGTVTLDPNQIQQKVTEHIARARLPFSSSTNIYFSRLNRLENAIMSEFPLQSVSIQRNGRSLNIEVTERVTTIALRTKEKTVMLDITGTYVRDATLEESRAIDIRIGTAAATPDEIVMMLQPDMPVVVNTQNEAVTEVAQAAATAYIALTEALPIHGMHAIALYIDGLDAPYVRIDTTAEYDIYADISFRSVEEQLQALHAVISANDFVAPQEYIDLRFGAYVYKK